MEEITMEKLLNNFNEVVRSFNKLVRNNDIKGVKKALQEIEKIVKEEKNIELDNTKFPNSDHVLHELLKNLKGHVKVEQVTDPKQVEEIIKIIKKLETKIKIIENQKLTISKKRINKLSDEDLDKEISERENAGEGRKPVESKEVTEETIFEQIRTYEENIKEIKILESKKEKTTQEETYIENLEIITALKIDRTSRYITKELNKAKAEKDKLLKQGISDEVNKDILLQNKLDELNELIDKYTECKDVIAKYRRSITSIVASKCTKIKKNITKNKEKVGLEPNVEAGEIDVDAEVEKIGDKIFKTAEIRKELASRNISREEFLKYYKEGLETSKENIKTIDKEIKKLEKLVQEEFIDKEAEIAGNEEEVDLAKIIFEEKQKGGNKEKLIIACNKVRKNLLDNGVKSDTLENEITEKNLNSFLHYLGKFTSYLEDETYRLSAEKFEQEESKQIFEKEIRIIEKEQATIESVENNQIVKDSEEEKKLRRAQISGFLYPEENPELIKEWQERFERFYSHKKQASTQYKNKDGEIQDVNYETIEDYPELEEDTYFLNLQDYKKYLEITTKYRNSENNKKILDSEAQKTIIELEENREKETGKKYSLEETIQEMEHYVESFHGHTNKYKTKYETYKTAGSTLKSMVPVKNLPTSKKALAIGENVFRFFGIRPPKFSRINESGEKIKDIKGGILTLATDALVVGGVTAAAIAGPITLASVGVAYAAKGIVTAGNLIAADITKRRHSYEIENNIPTAGISKDDAEVMRKDYYRAIEGKGRFSSWVKAKNDRFFRRGRAKETLEKIEQKRFEESDSAIDLRDSENIRQEQENIERARKNQEARQKNYETIAKNDDTYNAVVKNPDSLDIAQVEEKIVQNAVLRMREKNGATINSYSTEKLGNQYVKNNPYLIQTEDLKDIITDGGTVATTAITEEERYTARQQKVDRTNKVITGLLTIAGKLGIDAINGRFMEEVEKAKDEFELEFKDVKVKKSKGEAIQTDKVQNLEVSEKGLDNWYLKDQQTSFTDDIISKELSSTIDKPSAAAINFIDSNGKEYVASIAQSGLGYTTKHVHSLVNVDISSMSPTELIECISQNDTNFYNKLIKAMGLEEKPIQEIATKLVKGGNLSLQGKAMTGWREVLSSNVKETVEFVTRRIPTKIIQKTENVSEFNPFLVVLSALKGAGLGTAIGTVDQLHEAAHQTKRLETENFEQNTENLVPDNPIVSWARNGIESARRRIREMKKFKSKNYQDQEIDEER